MEQEVGENKYELSFLHPVSKEEMSFKVLPKCEGSWKILENVEL